MDPIIILGIMISVLLFISLIIFDFKWAKKKTIADDNWEKWAQANNLTCIREMPDVSATTWTFTLYFLIYGIYKGNRIYIFSMNSDKLGGNRSFLLSKAYLWLNGRHYKEFNSEDIDNALLNPEFKNFKEAGNYSYLKTLPELIVTLMGEIYIESGLEVNFQEAFKITKAMSKYYRSNMTIIESFFGRKSEILFNDEKALGYLSEQIGNEVNQEAILKVANKFQEFVNISKRATKVMLN